MAETPDTDEIEMWGDGNRTRSFLYIDECIEGSIRLMRSEWTGPVNNGSEEIMTINQPACMVMEIAGKKQLINHKPYRRPLWGCGGRNSDNRLIHEKLGWKLSQPLMEGLLKTYAWIEAQVRKAVQA